MKHLKIIITVIVLIFIIILVVGAYLIKPTMNISGETLEIAANSSEELKIPETKYFWKNITNKVKVEGKVDFNKIGIYEIKYKVPTMFGEYEQKQLVKIIDKKAPEIILTGEEEYKLL